LYEGSSDLFNFKPHEIDPKKSLRDFLWPRLAIQLSKEQTTLPKLKGKYAAFCGKKNTSRLFVGTQILFFTRALIVECGLITRNCQLACASFNYFHNHITLLEGNTYFNTKRFFVKNFLRSF